MATYWENSCSFGLRNVLWYKYLTVTLVFSHLGVWRGNLSLIAPFPDLCLLVPFLSLSFQGDTSVVVLFVLCFEVELSCCFSLLYVFMFLVKFV